jgi:hypothetical protein
MASVKMSLVCMGNKELLEILLEEHSGRRARVTFPTLANSLGAQFFEKRATNVVVMIYIRNYLFPVSRGRRWNF